MGYKPRERPAVITAHERAFNEGLAAQIQRYWAARGYEVKAIVRQGTFTQGFRGVPHAVESDMVNGYPKGFKHGR